jgi:hypothetical protein
LSGRGMQELILKKQKDESRQTQNKEADSFLKS